MAGDGRGGGGGDRINQTVSDNEVVHAMAARGKVFMRWPGLKGDPMIAKTDLTGHGNVNVGEQFTARECWPWGRCPLMKGGRRLRVRVTGVEVVHRSYHILTVEIVDDLTPVPAEQANLF